MSNKSMNQWPSLPNMIRKVPGSLVYRGHIIEPFKIDVYAYNQEGYERSSFERVQDFLKSPEARTTDSRIKWVNITGINHIEEIKELEDAFGISQIVLEQVLEISKHSSYIIDPEFFYSDVQMIYYEDQKIFNENIGLYKWQQFVFSFQERDGDVFNFVRERIEKQMGAIREADSGYCYFCLLDALVDHYIAVQEVVERRIETMEELVIDLEPVEINAIHDVRKQLMTMKFSINPMDKMMERCKQEGLLGPYAGKYLESLQNRINEVQNVLSIQKEMIDSIYENYILNNSNDMNRIMTTLTIFSAVFIPLSFLAGVFGMNFQHIPGLDTVNGFYYFIGGCLLTIVGMITFFKVKGWF